AEPRPVRQRRDGGQAVDRRRLAADGRARTARRYGQPPQFVDTAVRLAVVRDDLDERELRAGRRVEPAWRDVSKPRPAFRRADGSGLPAHRRRRDAEAGGSPCLTESWPASPYARAR